MKILIVEDDYSAAEGLQEDLREAMPDAEIEVIATESEFCAGLGRLRDAPPDAVVMDMMIRWADASPDGPKAPPEVPAAGPWRAGRRCLDRLREAGIDCPVVVYSILDEEDLKGELPKLTKLIAKAADSDEILNWLRECSGR